MSRGAADGLSLRRIPGGSVPRPLKEWRWTNRWYPTVRPQIPAQNRRRKMKGGLFSDNWSWALTNNSYLFCQVLDPQMNEWIVDTQKNMWGNSPKSQFWFHLNFLHVRRPASTGSSGASNAGGASLESRVARLERNFKAGLRWRVQDV